MEKKDRKAVTPAEAATMYGYTVGTLAQLRHRRQGPRFYKIGKKVLYFIDDLESWTRQQPVETNNDDSRLG